MRIFEVLLIVGVLVLVTPGPAHGSLLKPTYAAGDRWTYSLDGMLKGFPGANASFGGNASFAIVGFVTFTVVGPAEIVVGNVSVAAVRVDSRSSGFLNGSFPFPGGGGTALVTGSFTTTTSEYWELQGYLPVASSSTTVYQADVSYGLFTAALTASLQLDAATSIASIPTFDLDIGQSATASLDTHLEVNSTFTVFGRTTSMHNSTDVPSTWRREVLSQENITVAAGTFAAYRLNQTLGGFPGLPGGVSSGNETAYFANRVGFYAKRTAYENGTPVAEMNLKSYSYGARPSSGLSATDLLAYVVLPAAAAIVLFVILRRRRKARIQGRPSEAVPPDPERPR